MAKYLLANGFKRVRGSECLFQNGEKVAYLTAHDDTFTTDDPRAHVIYEPIDPSIPMNS